MRKDEQPVSTKRREFLKLAGLAGAATAVAVGGAVTATEAKAAAGDGYRETKHVKTYYELARF